MGILAVVAFTSGLTWIMGSDRTLAVSCYDGAGPRSLGKFSARFGTPLRVNVLSGIISSVIFVLATEITEGDAYKFFTVALNLAISTTLISYLGIFPAAWRLRRKNPHHPLPFKAPWLRVMTVLSVLWIVFCTIRDPVPGPGRQLVQRRLPARELDRGRALGLPVHRAGAAGRLHRDRRHLLGDRPP